MLFRLAVAFVLFAGCIEKAPQQRSQREDFDRGAVRDVTVASLPARLRRVEARFGAPEQVELAGCLVDPEKPRAGATVKVTFFFRVLDNEPDKNWKVFVHVDDHGGRAQRINGDHWPTGQGAPWATGGRYPMSAWKRNDIVRDDWSFSIPAFVDSEALDIWTGFYNPYANDDERLPLANPAQVTNDGRNRVLAGSIDLRE